jgi:hypothetical protein
MPFQDMDARNMPPRTWDFAFLSNRAFMLTSKRDSGCLCVYSFQGADTPSSSAQDRLTATHHATLHLPRFAWSPVQISHLTTHTSPYVEAVPRGVPFYTAPSTRIHAVSVGYTTPDPHNGHASFLLIFHNRLALAYINNDSTLTAPLVAAIEGNDHETQLPRRAIQHRDVPWEEWGPSQTRFMNHTDRFSWLRYVHGARIIYPPTSLDSSLASSSSFSSSGKGHAMIVLDFHVYPSRERSRASSLGKSTIPWTMAEDTFSDDDDGDDDDGVTIPIADLNGNDGGVHSKDDLSIGTRKTQTRRPFRVYSMSTPDDPFQIGGSGGTNTDTSTSALITKSTRINRKDIFEEDVVTSLPFRRTVREANKKYSGFMLDQDRIIGLPWKVSNRLLFFFSS